MTDLSLLMTGLCAFVPRYKIEEQEKERKGNRMRVLLIDSSRPADLPHMYHQHVHELHVPVLICNYDDVDGWGRQEDLRFLDAKGVIKALFYLDDQDVEIDSDQKESLEVVGKPIGYDCKDVKADSFFCVAPLEKISPESACPHDDCLKDVGVHKDVVSRIVLKEGAIKSGKLATRLDSRKQYKVVNWLYKVVDQDAQRRQLHRQVAADIVQVDVSLRSVKFNTKLFRDPRNPVVKRTFGDEKTLTIRLKPRAKMEVFIKNMPWPDILGTRTMEEYDPNVDLHFAHFYKITQSDLPEINVPHKDDLCDYNDNRHAGNPNCQPCLFCARAKA